MAGQPGGHRGGSLTGDRVAGVPINDLVAESFAIGAAEEADLTGTR